MGLSAAGGAATSHSAAPASTATAALSARVPVINLVKRTPEAWPCLRHAPLSPALLRQSEDRVARLSFGIRCALHTAVALESGSFALSVHLNLDYSHRSLS